jgi:precorrin-8X/cobalt-precorrin-8 methylmutase
MAGRAVFLLSAQAPYGEPAALSAAPCDTRRGGARSVMQPDAIYACSFAQIDALLAPLGLPSAEHQVARRVVHATGDPELASLLRFHPQAIDEGLTAIQAHCPIVVDVRMVAAGLNASWLAESGCPLHCAIEAAGASARAAERSTTRAALQRPMNSAPN